MKHARGPAPARELLAPPPMIAPLNALLGTGWRLDHSPFVICGDGRRAVTGAEAGQRVEQYKETAVPDPLGNIGGQIHGHMWDPEYRYHYANGVMRSGNLAVAYQLRDIEAGWGGFGIIPGSHKVRRLSDLSISRMAPRDGWPLAELAGCRRPHLQCNFRMPAELAESSLSRIEPPLVNPAAPAGSATIFFESALHASLPWSGSRSAASLPTSRMPPPPTPRLTGHLSR
jgi:hypothetical protein